MVEGPQGDPTCTNGADDDGDGATDGADPGCREDGLEGIGAATCSDGIDNDADGFVDGSDPDCSPPPTCSDTPWPDQNEDGVVSGVVHRRVEPASGPLRDGIHRANCGFIAPGGL
jgi:hypothetical protein